MRNPRPFWTRDPIRRAACMLGVQIARRHADNPEGLRRALALAARDARRAALDAMRMDRA